MNYIQKSREWNTQSPSNDRFQTALEDVDIVEISTLDNFKEVPAHLHLQGWWGVETDQGLIAYFAEETEANRFRLDYINRILND